MTRQEEIMEKSIKDKKNGFKDWMNNPMTKALISTVPPCENLEIILQACFESGYGCGVGSIMIDIITNMAKPRNN